MPQQVARGLRITLALLVTAALVAGLVRLVVGLASGYGWLAPALLTLVVVVWVFERWIFRGLMGRTGAILFFTDSPLWWRDWLPDLWRWALAREPGEDDGRRPDAAPAEDPPHASLSGNVPPPRRW